MECFNAVYKRLFTYIGIIICLFQQQIVYADNDIPALSSNARISLLTCSSGDELYSVFGHSAIRVYDDSLGIDVVYNYGTFDFNTPNFYLKFMNGDLKYMMSLSSFKRFMAIYNYEGRAVREGILQLDSVQRKQLWDFLNWNILPENRYYRYDFFFDNCATRIRDIVFNVKAITENDIRNNESLGSNSSKTFRDYIHSYVPEFTWTAQGIDLLLGMKTDDKADVYDRAYLPAYLDSLFINTNVISEETELLKRRDSSINDSFYFSPDMFGWLLLLISVAITIYEIRNKRYFKYFDILFFISCALLSLLFWYLWLFTKHSVCSSNLNVLWASVLYIPMSIMLFRSLNRYSNFSSKSMMSMSVLNILFLTAYVLLSFIGVQDTASMTIPISFALIIRNIELIRGINGFIRVE
ncbi:MAG: DUF4105 domain-containing protein [Bacteroidales bacterium]|nr:DUF4105 domain-containing protein [Bacteroidales bacterium]